MSLESYVWKLKTKLQLDSLKLHFPTLEVINQRFSSIRGEIVNNSDVYTVLTGTIPAPYKGKTYNYSIQMCLPLAFPEKPPLAKVVPLEGMSVRSSEYVSSNGHVSYQLLL